MSHCCHVANVSVLFDVATVFFIGRRPAAETDGWKGWQRGGRGSGMESTENGEEPNTTSS
eukprot:scaffold17542_cov122-Skeletonema_marinoi.AAC.3